MAPNTRITLEAVAEIQQAKSRILELETVVKQLQATVAQKGGQKAFEIDTSQAVNELKQLELGLEKATEKTKQAAVEVAAAEDKWATAVERAAERTRQAIEKRAALQEREKNKQALRIAGRIAADQKAAAEEIAAAERAAAGVIAAENKKAAAQERSKNQQAVRLASRIAAEERASAAVARAQQKEIETAHAAAIAYDRKRDKLLQAENAQNTFASSAQNAARAVQAFMASIVVQKIQEFIASVLHSAAAFETYRNTIIAAVGSTEVADAAIEHLRGTANTFGVSFETLLQRFGRFKVAADSVGFSVQETETIFDAFVAVSRALGNTNEQTERTFVALEQIMSKGVVQSEELKQQLGDSLVGAYNKLGARLGLTGLEFEKQLKQNEILAKKAIPELVAAYLELAGPAIQRNLSSLNAEIERSKNALFDAKREAGDAAAKEFKDLLQTLQIIGKEGPVSFSSIGSEIGNLISLVNQLVIGLNSLLSFRFGDAIGAGVAIAAKQLLRFKDIVDSIAVGLIEAFDRARGKSAEAARASAEEWRKVADEQKAGIRSWISELETGSEVSKRQAELRVQFEQEAADKVAKLQADIAALGERARQEELNGVRALTKEELKELRKREQAFETFFARIADLSQRQPKIALPNAPEATGGGVQSLVSPRATQEVAEAEKKVQDLTVALGKLIAEREAFQDGGFVKPEHLNRVNELSQSIASARQELKAANDAAAAAQLQAVFDADAEAARKLASEMASFSTQVKASLTDLVRDNDAFRDSFTRLDEGSQIAVESLVANLERAANAGRVTQADFQNFLSGIASIFGQAGLIGQQFAAGLQASFGQTQTSVTGLLTSLAELGPSALAGAAGVTQAAATVAASAEQQKIAVQEVGRVTTETFLKQADDAKAAVSDLASAAVQVVSTVGESNQKIAAEVASGQAVILDSTGKAVAEASDVIITKLDETTTAIESAADNAGAAQVRMVDAVSRGAGQSVAAITNTIDFATGKVDEFGGMVETVGDRGERAFSLVGQAASEAGAEVESTINIATDAAGKLTLSNEKIEQAGDAAVKALQDAGKEASDAAGEVGKVDTATKGAKTSSEGLAKAAEATRKAASGTPAEIDKVSVAIDAASTKMAVLKADFQECLSLALQLEQCLNRMAQ